LQINAKVSPTCGCPIEPNHLWNINTCKTEAELRRGDPEAARTSQPYAGQIGQFGQFAARYKSRRPVAMGCA
jgi:hypothetical protein